MIKKGFTGKVLLGPSLIDGRNLYTWDGRKGSPDKGHSMTKGMEGRRLENRGSKGVAGNKPEN